MIEDGAFKAYKQTKRLSRLVKSFNKYVTHMHFAPGSVLMLIPDVKNE